MTSGPIENIAHALGADPYPSGNATTFTVAIYAGCVTIMHNDRMLTTLPPDDGYAILLRTLLHLITTLP